MTGENEEQVGSNMDQEGALAALQGMGIDTSEMVSQAPAATVATEEQEPNPLLREPKAESSNEGAEATSENDEEKVVSTETSKSESVDDPSDKKDGEIDNPLFVGLGNSSDNLSEIEIKDLESLNPILSKYGIEDIKDLPGKLESYIESEKLLATATDEVERAKTIFQNMPAELYKAINDHFNGGNWRETLGVQGLDYEAKIETLDKKQLVNAFSPGEVTDEDWDEYNSEDGDPAVKRLVDRVIRDSQSKFESKKATVLSFRDDQIKEQLKIQENFTSSLNEATKSLKEKYPSMTQSDIQNLQKLADRDSLISTLYNQDGSVKSDSLTKLAMMTYGEDLVDKLMKVERNKIVRDTETKINEEKLLRSSDVPNVATSSSGKANVVSPEVQKQIDEAEKLIKYVS